MAKAIDKYVCPFCGQKTLFVGVHDDEGNYHGLVGCEYENDPWSGLSYALHHEGWGDCPLCTDGVYSTMGGMLFDTAEEAINALTPPNEWVSVEERLPEKKQDVLMLFKSGNMAVGWWHDADEHITFWCAYTDDGFYTDCDDMPTHWMPLPAPPDRRPLEGEA